MLNGLGFGALGWVGIGIAFWGAVAIPIYVLGHVSGQHINPAVTIPLWLTDCIETRAAAVYIVAQLAGGIAGSLVFALVLGIEAATAGAMGATVPFPSVTVWQAVINEAVITFFLMLTVMAFAIDEPNQHRAPTRPERAASAFPVSPATQPWPSWVGEFRNPPEVRDRNG